MWLQVFNLQIPTRWNLVATRDTMESCRHKETRGNRVATKREPVLASCGCRCSHVAASFQLADSDKMKSCRHKRHDGISSPQETRWNLVATRDTRKSCRHEKRAGPRPLVASVRWFSGGNRTSSGTPSGIGFEIRDRSSVGILLPPRCHCGGASSNGPRSTASGCSCLPALSIINLACGTRSSAMRQISVAAPRAAKLSTR